MTDGTPAPHQMPPLPAGVPRDPAIQAALDAEHVRLLGIVYYGAGGFTALASCFLIFHTGFFLFMGLNPQLFEGPSHRPVDAPPAAMLLAMAALCGTIMFLGWCFGALQIWAGRCLHQRRARTFVLIVASLEMVFIPWGTALAVWSFIILTKPGVAALFAGADRARV